MSAEAERLLGLALEWQQIATAATQSARELAAAHAPTAYVSEALALARRALALAAALEGIARRAPDAPRRD